MRIITQNKCLALLTLVTVFTLGLLVSWPQDLTASPASGPDEIAGASESVNPEETANPEESANPDDIAGASEHEPAYEPLQKEPVEREVNNALLGGGLGLAVVVIGGAIVTDKRKK